MTRIGQGAEAVLIRTPDGIRKERPKKSYRHPQLDEQLRTTRTRHEARLLERAANAGVRVPAVRQLDDTTLLLEDVSGVQLKDALDAEPLLAHIVGRMVAKLHDADVIHGDLTTSNILYDPETKHLTVIDFGLGFSSKRDEDKAVDLHVFHQSLASKHHRVQQLALRHFLAGYRASPHAEAVIARLRVVEARGRNKGS